MGEWEIKKLDRLVRSPITYGVVKPGSTVCDGVLFIRSGDISDGKIAVSNLRTISDEISNQYARTLLNGGELIISLVGNPGQVAIVPNSLSGANIARQVGLIRLSEEVDTKFVLYYLISPIGKEELSNQIGGSVQQVINLKDLKNVKILSPSLPEQKAIASLLSSLDDKIDLLHRQNKTLESMAETLFRQWFVNCDYTSKLSDLVGVQNGYAFKSKDFIDLGIDGLIKIKNISGNIVDIFNTDFLDEGVAKKVDSKFLIKSGDVLFAMTGAEIGKMGIVPQTDRKLWLNQRVGLFKEKYEGTRFLAYLQLKSEYGQDYIDNTATGSAQPNISSSGIENCEFPGVSKEQIIAYSKHLTPLYDKVIFNLGQVHNLEKLRDTLLPKLMSGEVRVEYELNTVGTHGKNHRKRH